MKRRTFIQTLLGSLAAIGIGSNILSINKNTVAVNNRKRRLGKYMVYYGPSEPSTWACNKMVNGDMWASDKLRIWTGSEWNEVL